MEFKLKHTTYVIDNVVDRHEILNKKAVEGLHRYFSLVSTATKELIRQFQRPKQYVDDTQALATSEYHSVWMATAYVVELFYNGLEESLVRTTKRTSQNKRRGVMTKQQLESLLLCHFYGSHLKWLMDEAIMDGARIQKCFKHLLEMGEAFCKDAPRSSSNTAVISSVMMKDHAQFWNNFEHFILPEFEGSMLPAMLAVRQAIFLQGDRLLEKLATLNGILGGIMLWMPSQFMPVGGYELLLTEDALGTPTQLVNAPWMDSFPIREWKTREIAQKFQTICSRFAEKVFPQHASRQGAPNCPSSTPENAAAQEANEKKNVEEPTQEEAKTDEEVRTTVVTPAQEQEISTESLGTTVPYPELPELVPDALTDKEAENVDPTTPPAPEDSPNVDTVLVATEAPIFTTSTRPPVVIRTIKPTVPVATEDRQDLEEDPKEPIIAAKPGDPRNDAETPHAIRAEVASCEPNSEVGKLTIFATEAHKAKPSKPRDADENAPARMPGHVGLNETPHHSHGDHAEGRAETSTAHSAELGFH